MLTLVLENNIQIQLQNEALQHARFDGVRQIIELQSNPNYPEKKFKEYYYAPFIQIAILNDFLTNTEIDNIQNLKITRIILEEDGTRKEFLIMSCSSEKGMQGNIFSIKLRGRNI